MAACGLVARFYRGQRVIGLSGSDHIRLVKSVVANETQL